MDRQEQGKRKPAKRASTKTNSQRNPIVKSARVGKRTAPRDVEQFDRWYEKTFGHPFQPDQPSWQWPPNYPPGFPQKATQRIKWLIDEAERMFKEGHDALPQSDPGGHDRQLEYLLLDFASLIYCAFLDEAEEQLRSGEWSVGKHDSQDFSVIAGRFMRDIAEGVFHKFRKLAASPENKDEWRARVIVHSELVFAVFNSIRNRQKRTDLNAAIKEYLFEPDAARKETRKLAEDKGNPALLEEKEIVTFQTAERYLGITERQRQNLIKSGSLATEGQGQNRRITTDSLKRYLPPRKPEATRNDPK